MFSAVLYRIVSQGSRIEKMQAPDLVTTKVNYKAFQEIIFTAQQGDVNLKKYRSLITYKGNI